MKWAFLIYSAFTFSFLSFSASASPVASTLLTNKAVPTQSFAPPPPSQTTSPSNPSQGSTPPPPPSQPAPTNPSQGSPTIPRKRMTFLDATWGTGSEKDLSHLRAVPSTWVGEGPLQAASFYTNRNLPVDPITPWTDYGFNLIAQAQNAAFQNQKTTPLYIGNPATWSSTLNFYSAGRIILDFEAFWDNPCVADSNNSKITAAIHTFNQYKTKGVLTGVYSGFPAGEWNRNYFNTYSSLTTPSGQTDALACGAIATAPLIDELDYISPDVYMLGSDFIDRDIQYVQNVCVYMKKLTRKPILPFVWGRYNNAPNYTPIPVDVLKRYYNVIQTYCDGAVIWGAQTENVDLLKVWAELSP